uniref:Transposase Tc1-like domain-containing protein n=1 Tax=Gasterosteus aculeatus aculeatus TaxID=481459 RepID=A0AAQ4QMS3_GASAC
QTHQLWPNQRFGTFLRRKNAPVSSATPKDPEEQKNTLQEGGASVSKSTIKGRLHQSKYRGFATTCKPLVSLKNRKTRLEFAKKHLKQPVQFWKNILWADETQINLYQNDGKRRVWRRRGTAHDPKHTSSSVKHGGGGVMAWPCMAANGTGALVFIDDVTADKSSRMNSEVFRPIFIFSQMLHKSLDGASQSRWTMTRSVLRKQPRSCLRQRSGMFCNGQVKSPDLNPIEHAFHFLKTKLKGKCPRTSRN